MASGVNDMESAPTKVCKRCKCIAQTGLKCVSCGVVFHSGCLKYLKIIIQHDDGTINCCLKEQDASDSKAVQQLQAEPKVYLKRLENSTMYGRQQSSVSEAVQKLQADPKVYLKLLENSMLNGRQQSSVSEAVQKLQADPKVYLKLLENSMLNGRQQSSVSEAVQQLQAEPKVYLKRLQNSTMCGGQQSSVAKAVQQLQVDPYVYLKLLENSMLHGRQQSSVSKAVEQLHAKAKVYLKRLENSTMYSDLKIVKQSEKTETKPEKLKPGSNSSNKIPSDDAQSKANTSNNGQSLPNENINIVAAKITKRHKSISVLPTREESNEELIIVRKHQIIKDSTPEEEFDVSMCSYKSSSSDQKNHSCEKGDNVKHLSNKLKTIPNSPNTNALDPRLKIQTPSASNQKLPKKPKGKRSRFSKSKTKTKHNIPTSSKKLPLNHQLQASLDKPSVENQHSEPKKDHPRKSSLPQKTTKSIESDKKTKLVGNRGASLLQTYNNKTRDKQTAYRRLPTGKKIARGPSGKVRQLVGTLNKKIIKTLEQRRSSLSQTPNIISNNSKGEKMLEIRSSSNGKEKVSLEPLENKTVKTAEKITQRRPSNINFSKQLADRLSVANEKMSGEPEKKIPKVVEQKRSSLLQSPNGEREPLSTDKPQSTASDSSDKNVVKTIKNRRPSLLQATNGEQLSTERPVGEQKSSNSSDTKASKSIEKRRPAIHVLNNNVVVNKKKIPVQYRSSLLQATGSIISNDNNGNDEQIAETRPSAERQLSNKVPLNNIISSDNMSTSPPAQTTVASVANENYNNQVVVGPNNNQGIIESNNNQVGPSNYQGVFELTNNQEFVGSAVTTVTTHTQFSNAFTMKILSYIDACELKNLFMDVCRNYGMTEEILANTFSKFYDLVLHEKLKQFSDHLIHYLNIYQIKNFQLKKFLLLFDKCANKNFQRSIYTRHVVWVLVQALRPYKDLCMANTGLLKEVFFQSITLWQEDVQNINSTRQAQAGTLMSEAQKEMFYRQCEQYYKLYMALWGNQAHQPQQKQQLLQSSGQLRPSPSIQSETKPHLQPPVLSQDYPPVQSQQHPSMSSGVPPNQFSSSVLQYLNQQIQSIPFLNARDIHANDINLMPPNQNTQDRITSERITTTSTFVPSVPQAQTNMQNISLQQTPQRAAHIAAPFSPALSHYSNDDFRISLPLLKLYKPPRMTSHVTATAAASETVPIPASATEAFPPAQDTSSLSHAISDCIDKVIKQTLAAGTINSRNQNENSDSVKQKDEKVGENILDVDKWYAENMMTEDVLCLNPEYFDLGHFVKIDFDVIIKTDTEETPDAKNIQEVGIEDRSGTKQADPEQQLMANRSYDARIASADGSFASPPRPVT